MWTAEKDALLREMAPTHTAVEIAAKVGATRNAVIGRAHRRGISLAKPDRPRGFANRQPDERGRQRRPRFPEGRPARRGRPKGSHAFSLDQRAAAVAARMAGASLKASAALVGGSSLSLTKNWATDPAVAARANEIFAQAVAMARREKALRLQMVEAARLQIAAHNETVIAGWGERNKTWVRRKLAGESLAAIGADFGVTRERVRQVLMKAVAAGLKSPPGMNLLRDRVTP